MLMMQVQQSETTTTDIVLVVQAEMLRESLAWDGYDSKAIGLGIQLVYRLNQQRILEVKVVVI